MRGIVDLFHAYASCRLSPPQSLAYRVGDGLGLFISHLIIFGRFKIKFDISFVCAIT
jgi:hypothetical protein